MSIQEEIERIEVTFKFQRNWLVMAGMWPEIGRIAEISQRHAKDTIAIAVAKAKLVKRGRPPGAKNKTKTELKEERILDDILGEDAL